MQFVKDRLNRDNFWTLMFWVGIAVGLALALNLSPKAGGVIFWVTMIFIPWLIKRKHGMKLDKKKHFLNSEGKSLKKKYPKNIYGMLLLSAFSFPLFGLLLDEIAKGVDIPDGLLVSFPVFVLVLYFIMINCPISILFYRSAWSKNILGEYPTSDVKHNSSSSTSRSYTTDPAYRSLSSNVFHSSKR